MELKPQTISHGFKITACEELPEIDGQAIVGVHEESGAKLLYLKNDDVNKSFAIGFKTPPADDTGVFHILEHSVLCGSRKFPVKEPFVDLLKGSMQTFLNAMTFSDKTLYPVASTNDRDLRNLMDVYLDAVFHPRIYNKRAIFEQEGWHYEIETTGAVAADSEATVPEDEQVKLVYNGVVFNEMKGALSDANSVLFDELQAALFPDTPYAFESGGTPSSIPTLTYEQFLDEHRRHYRTDNSYIILYGNLDIDEALAFIDEEYLVPVAAEQREADAARIAQGLEPLRPRELNKQAPLRSCGIVRPMDTAPENACAGAAFVLGDAGERTKCMAVSILISALFGSNESPCKRYLLDNGAATDVSAFIGDASLQPFAIVQFNMPSEQTAAQPEAAVADAVAHVLDAGLDHALVEAALSHTEFRMREHEMDIADGVVYSMNSLASWLYDDDAPIDYIRYEKEFEELRASLDSDYFERLARDVFIDNDHVASVNVVPTPGQPDNDIEERLALLASELTAQDCQRISDETDMLRALQEAPDSPEDIATLPRLSISDLDEAPVEPPYGLDPDAPATCVRHDVQTHGITYTYRFFDAGNIPFDELPYLAVLSMLLGKLDTTHRTAAEIDTLAQGKLGNMSFYTSVMEPPSSSQDPKTLLVVSASALSDNVAWAATLPRDIMLETNYSNTDKILDVLQQRKIGMEQMFASYGHASAITRLQSYYSKAAVVRQQLEGIDFYRFLCNLIENYDEVRDEIPAHLESLAGRIFGDNVCTFGFAGSDEDRARFWESDPVTHCEIEAGEPMTIPQPTVRNEAFIVPSDVCYAAAGWNVSSPERPYSGIWAVAGRVLSFDYLWNEVRVKGGAYGVGYSMSRLGNSRFYSYRDPHLDETLERFAAASDWLASFDPSQEDMEGYIVATVATLDAPVKPRMRISQQLSDFFHEMTPEKRLAIRSEAIQATVPKLRALSDELAETVSHGARCVFGNREIIESAKTPFDVIELIG